MKHHILYIPGLGDHYDGFRRLSLKFWRLWGVSAELVEMKWYDGGSFESKYHQIDAAIQRAERKGKEVYVVGESAGATMALHIAKNHPQIVRTVTLCGVARPETPISSSIRRKAPALDEAVSTLPTSFDNADIISIRALEDSVVGPKYSTAVGARPRVIWSLGHFLTIVLALTILAPYAVNVITSKNAHA